MKQIKLNQPHVRGISYAAGDVIEGNRTRHILIRHRNRREREKCGNKIG